MTGMLEISNISYHATFYTAVLSNVIFRPISSMKKKLCLSCHQISYFAGGIQSPVQARELSRLTDKYWHISEAQITLTATYAII